MLGSTQRQNRVFRREARFANVVDHQTRCVGSHEIQQAQRHTHDTIREDSWTEIQEESLPLGEQVLARHSGANVKQLLQQWVTAFGQAWTPSVLSI